MRKLISVGALLAASALSSFATVRPVIIIHGRHHHHYHHRYYRHYDRRWR